jgi:uncharacterized protein
MPVDQIRYDLLVQDAQRNILRLVQDARRNIVRTVLADVAIKGIPGDHNFYIAFDTRAGGVRLSERLKASYPETMTIVLQHQFWELVVGEDGFDVVLEFNGIPERLHVPFRAMLAFEDRSVQFGLQFDPDIDVPADAAETAPEPEAAAEPPPGSGPAAAEEQPAPAESARDDNGSAEVVRLDRFRRK